MIQLKKFFSSFYGRVLLPALFLRFALMPFFYHQDIKSHHFHFYFLSQKILNLYQYLAVNLSHLPYTDTFNYPPLVYFTFGGLQFLLRPFLGPDFVAWLWDWGPRQFFNPFVFRYLFVLKLPYLVFDLAMAWLLTQFFAKVKQKRAVFLLWLFNPLSLYAIYVLGTFDLLPSFLVLLAVWLILKGNYYRSALSLGLAIAFKTYPVLFLPFLFLSTRQQLRKKLIFLVISLAPYLISLLPFLTTAAFRQSVLFSGLTQRLFLANIYLGFGENLILFVGAYVLLFFFTQQFFFTKEEKIIPLLTAILLLIFIFSHFHPQWILWLLPFLTLALVRKPAFLWPQIAFYLAFLGVILLFNDRGQLFSLLLPLNVSFTSVPSFFEILRDRKIIDPFLLQSLAHSLLAGTGFWMIYLHLKKDV